jgi:hypothetical protein
MGEEAFRQRPADSAAGTSDHDAHEEVKVKVRVKVRGRGEMGVDLGRKWKTEW